MGEVMELPKDILEAHIPSLDQSTEVNKLFDALSKAQMMIGNAHKDKSNPYFNSSYADLTSCWDACREALGKNGLSVIQLPGAADRGILKLTTVLGHSSGQFIQSHIFVPLTKNDAQGFGSALTYARRYGLCAICGISPADDDGNAASLKTAKPASVAKKGASGKKNTTKTKGKESAPVVEADDGF